MSNCGHDPTGICKSCRQTQQEGGNVVLHASETDDSYKKPVPPPEVKEKPPVKITPFRSKKGK